jgi:hypothetical protein
MRPRQAMTERDSLRLEMVSAATMASREVNSCHSSMRTTINVRLTAVSHVVKVVERGQCYLTFEIGAHLLLERRRNLLAQVLPAPEHEHLPHHLPHRPVCACPKAVSTQAP